jgi:hypothetical protein
LGESEGSERGEVDDREEGRGSELNLKREKNGGGDRCIIIN